jgi:hypothetical protein
VDHKASVQYAAVALRKAKLDGWTAEIAGGVVLVSGPCPECFGAAYGPNLPKAEAVDAVSPVLFHDQDRPPVPVVLIEAECHCGSDHGKEGATSCGRRWVVQVADQ